MSGTFEFELDERVQAVVEGRICARKDSTDRGNEYIVETRGPTGRPIYRSFAEHELDDPEDAEPAGAVVVPLRAA